MAHAAPAPAAGGKTWKDYFQWFIWFLRLFTLIALTMNLVAYILVIKIGVTSDSNKPFQKVFLVLSNSGFAFFIIALGIAEFQPVWFVKRVMILHYWGGRGFGQAFMGIQLINSAAAAGAGLSEGLGGSDKAMQTFAEVSGWILFSVGMIMILMSVMCLRGMVQLKADVELETALLKDQGGAVVIQQHTTKAVSSGEVYASEATSKLQKEVEDYQTLVQNMSTAMGVSYVVASSKFGGKAGAQAAENFQKDMKNKANAAGNAAKQEFNKASAAVESAASNFSPKNNDNNNSGPSGGGGGDTGGGGSSSVSMPKQDDDEPVGRRRRAQMDDDELERMYYGK